MNNTGSVLLVEDDANIQRINRRILEREGFYVYCAACLQEAYEILNVRRLPDPLSAGLRPHSHCLEVDQPCPGSGGAAARTTFPEQDLRRAVWPGAGLRPSVCGGLAAAILRARTA